MTFRETRKSKRKSKVSKRRYKTTKRKQYKSKKTRKLRKRRQYGGKFSDAQLEQIKTELRNIGFRDDEMPSVFEKLNPISSSFLRHGTGFDGLLIMIRRGGLWDRSDQTPITNEQKRINLINTLSENQFDYRRMLAFSEQTDSDTESEDDYYYMNDL